MATHAGDPAPLYGVMAEFESPDALVGATREAYARGYRRMDAYSPFPIEELGEALGLHGNLVPAVVLTGGVLGGIAGFLMQYYVAVIHYPLNVGGRPLNSWPVFIPVTFECTVLAAALSAVVGLFILNKLPEPYHPVFNIPRFAMASRDRFFLCIESSDPEFDREATTRFLLGLNPREVTDVAP